MTIRRLKRLERNERGNVAMIFALSSVGLFSLVGGGLEVTRIVDGKGKLQSALDAGALAAAGMPEGTSNYTRELMANKIVAANLRVGRGIVTSSLVVSPDFVVTDRVKLFGEIKVETVVGQAIFGGFHTIKAESTAQKGAAGSPAIPGTQPAPNCPAQPAAKDAPDQASPPPPSTSPPPPSTSPPPPPAASSNGCFWALSTQNKDGVFRFNSGNNINAPTCRMYSHGPHNQSVQWNTGNSLNIDKLFTKGGINCNATCLASFVTYAGSQVLADPYASGLPQLTAGACKPSTGPHDGSVTLTPGTYCHDVTVQGSNPVLTLQPGIYHIKGNWNLNGAVVNGNGVTLYFEGDTQWNLNGNTRLNLKAPTSGPTAGLAMYEKYGLGTMTRPIDAGGGMNIEGIIYFPSKLLNFNSNNQVTSMGLQIIAKEMIFGNSRYNISPYTGPLPPGFGSSSPPPPASPPPPPPSPPPALPISSGSGLLTNGSFEDPAIAAGTEQHFTTAQGIPGWTSTGGFELHNAYFSSNGVGFGTDGVQYAEIEQDLSQTITLPAGKTYNFTFDYYLEHAGGAQKNEFDIIWDGKVLGNFQTNSGLPWKRITFPIRGTGAPAKFTFLQSTASGPVHEIFLDRVRIDEDNSLTAPPDGCPGGLPLPPPPPPIPAVPATPLRLVR